MAEQPVAWVEETKDDGIEYFFLAPDSVVDQNGQRGGIYDNPDNFPLNVIQKSFNNHDLFIRFAYNKGKRLLYLQDKNVLQPIENDTTTINAINKIVRWIKKDIQTEPHLKGEIEAEGDGYGDPPSTCIARKLSDYHSTWAYLNNYFDKEFGVKDENGNVPELRRLAGPKDINVCEFFASAEDEAALDAYGYVVGFEKEGGELYGKKFHGPTLFVNKAMHGSKKFNSETPDEVDYGFINLQLTAFYLKHFNDITKASLSEMDQLRLQLRARMDESGYDVYYAIFNSHTNAPEIYEYGKNQLAILNEEQARKLVQQMFAEEFKKKYPDKPIPDNIYHGPVIVFSYLPHRGQLVWNNIDPKRVGNDIYQKMIDGIRGHITQYLGMSAEHLIESYDPSTDLPHLQLISSFGVVWDYIKNIMGPRYGFDPEDYNIEVLMCPKPVGNAIAVYFRSQQEEKKGLTQMALSHGISVSFPFIAVNTLVKNIGTRQNALIHEYEHYIDETFKKTKKVDIRQGSFNEEGISPEEKANRFYTYIRNPHEHTAHLEQMVYMLHLGMDDQSILNTFVSKNDMAFRAEYRNILEEAKNIYKVDRQKKIEKYGPTVKTAAVDITINNWFWQGLQENINTQRHTNDSYKRNPKLVPEPIRVQPNVPQKKYTLEELLSRDWDDDESFFKSLEQLLDESRI